MSISDHDKRQYIKMQEQILKYQKGKLALSGLIGDLDFLVNSLESVQQEFKKMMQEHILDLEEVYAVCLDVGQNEPDENGQAIIKDAINKLSFLIKDNL
jgi:hypothetical protein